MSDCPRRQEGESQEAHQDTVAAWMGYADRHQLNTEHDDLHRSLCTWLDLTSHAMRDAAGETLTDREKELAAYEEDAVLAVQRLRQMARREKGDPST